MFLCSFIRKTRATEKTLTLQSDEPEEEKKKKSVVYAASVLLLIQKDGA